MIDRELLKNPIGTIDVTPTKDQSPPSGYLWLVLGGTIDHVTGTDSSLHVLSSGDLNIQPIGWIDTGYATSNYDARAFADFVTGAEERLSFNPSVIIVTPADKIHLDGHANAVARVRIVQVKTP